MSRVLKCALLLVEFTSIPLAVIGLVYLLTGYQLLLPGHHIFPHARAIHTDRALRVLLVAFSTVHCYSGLLLLLNRTIRRRKIKDLLEALVTALTILFAVLFACLELVTLP